MFRVRRLRMLLRFTPTSARNDATTATSITGRGSASYDKLSGAQRGFLLLRAFGQGRADDCTPPSSQFAFRARTPAIVTSAKRRGRIAMSRPEHGRSTGSELAALPEDRGQQDHGPCAACTNPDPIGR